MNANLQELAKIEFEIEVIQNAPCYYCACRFHWLYLKVLDLASSIRYDPLL